MTRHMSAREALLIVWDGVIAEEVTTPDDQMLRALKILTALVEAHEARCAEWDTGSNRFAINIWYMVRSIERGDDPK